MLNKSFTCKNRQIQSDKENCYLLTLIFTLLFIILFASRPFTGRFWFVDDALMCGLFVLIITRIKLSVYVTNTLEFLGKHSFNIFLFHTFIYYYWFSDFIYASRNPVIIFFLLLVITVIVSVGIEYLKKIIGFYKIQTWILTRLK